VTILTLADEPPAGDTVDDGGEDFDGGGGGVEDAAAVRGGHAHQWHRVGGGDVVVDHHGILRRGDVERLEQRGQIRRRARRRIPPTHAQYRTWRMVG